MGRNTLDFKKIFEKLLSPTGTKVILIVGISVIALIFFSQLISSGAKQQPDNAASSSTSANLADYSGQLEKQMNDLLTNIDGVGKSEVVITFENGIENVYQQQLKQTVNQTEQTQDAGQKQKTQNNDDEKSTVVLNDENGGQEALLQTQRTPRVEGVVVVCEGGGDPQVQENVTRAVSTALGVSTNHVYVTKMSQKQP